MATAALLVHAAAALVCAGFLPGARAHVGAHRHQHRSGTNRSATIPRYECHHDRLLQRFPAMRNVVHGPPGGTDGDGAQRRLSATTYAPLRIGVQYVNFASDSNMDSTLLSFLQGTVIPTAISRLQQFLQFNRLTTPLYAHRQCTSYDESTTPANCVNYAATTGCANDPSSDDVVVNFASSQLGADTYYTWNSGSGRYSNAVVLPAGTGFPGYDFVLFATAKSTATCGSPSTGGAIAYALTCQRDGATDRPTFGRANFCPLMLKEYYSDPQSAIYVVMHEMLHALGFTSDSWPLFRFGDAAMTPRTPRNPLYPFQPADAYLATYNCGGYTYGTYVPGSNTIAYFSERGMSSCSTPNGLNPPDNCVARFVTPTAVAAAQSFFNCSSVPGPELENQMTTPCELQGSHWEFRVFASEMLNSFDTGMRQQFSTMTVAVLEDAGWGYKGNYSAVDTFQHDIDWGYKQGCTFASATCLTPGTLAGIGSPPHFKPSAVSDESVCRIDRIGYGAVGVGSFSSIPSQYQYYPGQPTQGGTDYYGVPAHDYCPMVVWTGAERFCTDAHSSTETNSLGMRPGPSALCLSSTLRASASTATSRGVGCYGAVCVGGTSLTGAARARPAAMNISITGAGGAGVLTKTCTAAGQSLAFTGYAGTITCPDVAGICSPVMDLTNGTGVPASAYLPASATPAPSVSPSPGPPSASPSSSLAPVAGAGSVLSGQVALSLCVALAGSAPSAVGVLSASVAAKLRCDTAAAIAMPAAVTASSVTLVASYRLLAGPGSASAIDASSALNTPNVSCSRRRLLLAAEEGAGKAEGENGAGEGDATSSYLTTYAADAAAAYAAAVFAFATPGPVGQPRRVGRLGPIGSVHTTAAPAAADAAGAADEDAVAVALRVNKLRRLPAATPSVTASYRVSDALCVAMVVSVTPESAAGAAQAALQGVFSSPAGVAAAYTHTTAAAAVALAVQPSSLTATAGYAVIAATPAPAGGAGGAGGGGGASFSLGDILRYLLYAAAAVAAILVCVVVVTWYSRAGKRRWERQMQQDLAAAQLQEHMRAQQAAELAAVGTSAQSAQERETALFNEQIAEMERRERQQQQARRQGGGSGGGGGATIAERPSAPGVEVMPATFAGSSTVVGSRAYLPQSQPQMDPIAVSSVDAGGGSGAAPRGWSIAPASGSSGGRAGNAALHDLPVATAIAAGYDPGVWYGVDATGRPVQVVDGVPANPDAPGPRGWPAHVVAGSSATANASNPLPVGARGGALSSSARGRAGRSSPNAASFRGVALDPSNAPRRANV